MAAQTFVKPLACNRLNAGPGHDVREVAGQVTAGYEGVFQAKEDFRQLIASLVLEVAPDVSQQELVDRAAQGAVFDWQPAFL